MTKKELDILLIKFKHSIMHYHDSILELGAEMFVNFINEEGVLQPDTIGTLQDAHGECEKLK